MAQQLLIFFVLFLTAVTSAAQNLTLPSSDWEVTDNEDGTILLKYKGNKYVKGLNAVPLPTFVTAKLPELALEIGNSITFIANIFPDLSDVDKSVTWESNNVSVATVDANGKVTAISSGKAKITVTTNKNKKKDEFIVNVPARFSISQGKRVLFSPGNLQKRKSDGKYQFAENQWDYLGEEQRWGDVIDLFEWNGDIGKSIEPDKGWFMLSKDEWEYLMGHSQKKYREITVGGQTYRGMIILPDGCMANVNDEWSVLEQVGAVFLPLTGEMHGGEIHSWGQGYYWSSTRYDDNYIYIWKFGDELGTGHQRSGYSVRLVRY